MKKNKQHPLEDDISPIMRCNKCYQPYSFGYCDCNNKNPKKKVKTEIINSLHAIENIVIFHQEDKGISNMVCRELRKIHKRIDKLTK